MHYSYEHWLTDTEQDNFFNTFGIEFEDITNENGHADDKAYSKKALKFVYFSFTTLSTVGFGDMYPVSNIERIFGAILVFAGTILFSYIMTILTDIINGYIVLDEEFEDSINLDKFFSMIQYFNHGLEVNKDFRTKVTEFLVVKWSDDKNNLTMTENDQSLLEQLPADVQVLIFKKFLHQEFLIQFRRIFTFTLKQ